MNLSFYLDIFVGCFKFKFADDYYYNFFIVILFVVNGNEYKTMRLLHSLRSPTMRENEIGK